MRVARFQVQGETAAALDVMAIRIMQRFLDIGNRASVEQFQYDVDARPVQMAHGDEHPVLWEADVTVHW